MGRGGWFVCVRSQSRPSSTHLRKGHSEWRRLGGTCRGLAGPRYSLYVRVTGKVSRRFRSSVIVSHGLPQYPSVARGDVLRGSGQCPPQTHAAIRHLTRSRPNCRTLGSISCRLLSLLHRDGPPTCLYANPARDVARSGNFRPAAPVPTRSSESVGGNACPSACPLCSRGTICPETLATERPEARRVPTGHLASRANTSRRVAVRALVLPISARPPKSVAGIRVCAVLRDTPPSLERLVARNRPAPAAAAFRHRATRPHAGDLPNTWGAFVQIPDGRRAKVLLHPIMQIQRGIWRDLHPDLPGRSPGHCKAASRQYGRSATPHSRSLAD